MTTLSGIGVGPLPNSGGGAGFDSVIKAFKFDDRNSPPVLSLELPGIPQDEGDPRVVGVLSSGGIGDGGGPFLIEKK